MVGGWLLERDVANALLVLTSFADAFNRGGHTRPRDKAGAPVRGTREDTATTASTRDGRREFG